MSSFVDVLNRVLADHDETDMQRRARVVRVLATLGYMMPPAVWQVRWQGVRRAAYQWSDSPAGDLWLVAGRSYVDLRVDGDVLNAAVTATSVELTPEYEDDVATFRATHPATWAKVRAQLMRYQDVVAAVPPILVPRDQRAAVRELAQQISFGMRPQGVEG